MNFRKDINGLRAIAVAAVVLYHFNVPFFTGGYVGVDVFFVISGFLMTGLILGRMEQNRFSLLAFYLDRVKRIVPALLVVCLAVLVAGWFLLPPSEYATLGTHASGALGFYSNFLFFRESGYFDANAHEKWLLHTWSLSAEWQFYVLYPVLILVFQRWLSKERLRVSLLATALVSFVSCVVLTKYWENAAFYLLPTRAWEMLAGGLAYLCGDAVSRKHSRIAEGIGIAFITYGIFAFNTNLAWPGSSALVPVLGAVMVILAARQNSLATSGGPSQFLGKISYSVYLWHWPLVIALHYFELDKQLGCVVLAVAASVVAGYLSWRFIEQRAPLLYAGRDGAPSIYRTTVSGLAGTTAIVMMAGLGIGLTKGMPGRVSSAVLVADNERNNVSPYSAKCHAHAWTSSPGCVIGDEFKHVAAIVIGDSHSESSVTAVANAIPNGKGGALFLGYAGCLTVRDMHKAHVRADFQCAAYMDKTFDRLSKEYVGTPVIVINRTSYYVWGEDEAGTDREPKIYFSKKYEETSGEFLADFKQRYISSMCTLARNHPVFVTLPIPEMPVDPVRKLARSLMRSSAVADIALDKADYERKNAFVIEAMKAAQQTCNVHLLDPTAYLCKGQQCMGSRASRPLYIDTNHLSEYGNRSLVPMFETIFR